MELKTVLSQPVSVLMPVCNEIDVIEDVVREWHHEVFQHLPSGSELIMNDCSRDGTDKILEDLQKEFPYLRLILTEREGFYKAAIRLYAEAKNPLIFFTDSDGQYVPSEFWKIAPDIAKHDIVHGAKVRRNDPAYRLLASGVFNFLANLVFKLKSEDINSAFRLIQRPTLEALLLKIRHIPTLLNAEMLIRAEVEGYRVKSTGVEHRPRKSGKSRGLPVRGFLKECILACRGLLALKKEYRSFFESKNPQNQAEKKI